MKFVIMHDKKWTITPFVKWVGGKKQVIDKYLKEYLPVNFNDYYEPFVGGGAMLFFLKNNNSHINDLNKELMITYKVIKDSPNELMNLLDTFLEKHDEKFYYEIRNKNFKKEINIAARFIYLNKTCFNGIYRVNSKGKFNVPFNKTKKENLNLYDKKNLLIISEYFNNSNITFENQDYLLFLEKPKKNDFVFVDSPYDYEVGIKGFDSYNKSSFGQKNQILLAKKLIELDKKGVMFMATNHSTKLIKELYQNFKIIEIKTNRSINSNGNKRKNNGNEVIIINY